MKLRLRLLCTISICLYALSASAQESGKLAGSLEESGRWALAAAYFEKAAYEEPSQAYAALEKKARCLINGSLFKEAAATLERIPMRSVPEEERCTLLHEKALANHLAGNAESAATYLDEAFAADSLSGDKLLAALIYNECFRFDDGFRCVTAYMAEAGSDSETQSAVGKLYQKTPRRHNENVATVLSIIPGLGHIYSGAWKEAALSIALNGIVITFGTAQALGQMYVTALLGAGIPLSYTYMGASSRAISLVEERNSAKISEFNLKLISLL